MSSNDLSQNLLIKVVFAGGESVGKTSLINTFLTGNIGCPNPTIGANLYNYRSKNGRNITFSILDTAGQERFRSLTSNYFRNAHAIVLVFDITRSESFSVLDTYISSIRDHALPSCKILLVGNKLDIVSHRLISSQQIQDFSLKIQSEAYFETSAITRQNVNLLFEHLFSLFEDESPPTPIDPLPQNNISSLEDHKSFHGCCF